MAIRHPKHGYLTKEQFLKKNWLITLDFSFSRFSSFSFLWWGFILFPWYSFACLDLFKYLERMMEKNIILFFIISFFYSFFLLGILVVKGMPTWCIPTMWIVLIGFFWSKVICVVLVNGYGFSQIGIVLGLLAQRGSSCPN